MHTYLHAHTKPYTYVYIYTYLYTHVSTYTYTYTARGKLRRKVVTGQGGGWRKIRSSVVMRKPTAPLFYTVSFPCSRK